MSQCVQACRQEGFKGICSNLPFDLHIAQLYILNALLFVKVVRSILAAFKNHRHPNKFACAMHLLQGLGDAPPSNFEKIRCSKITSEVILGQKQSRRSYVAFRVLDPVLGCISYPCTYGHLSYRLQVYLTDIQYAAIVLSAILLRHYYRLFYQTTYTVY